MNCRNIQLLIIMLLSICSFSLTAQSKEQVKKERDSIYQINIKKSRLYGSYIPKDLDDAFAELKKLSGKESLRKYVMLGEEEVAEKLFYGVGRWMRHNWVFDEGSRFSLYLVNQGLRYPDDMVFFMLRSFHRHLLGKPLESEALILELNKKREQIKLNKLQGKDVLNEETRQRQKPNE